MKETTMISTHAWLKAFLLMAAVLLGKVDATARQSIPQGVKATAEKRSGNNKINKWVVDKHRNKYLAVLANGAIVEIGLGGNWIRTSEHLPESKLPEAVSDVVSSYMQRGYEADNFVFVQQPDTAGFYTIDLTSDDDDATLFVSAQGAVIKKESR